MENHKLGLSLVHFLEMDCVKLFDLCGDSFAESKVVVAVLQRVEIYLPEIRQKTFPILGFRCKIH